MFDKICPKSKPKGKQKSIKMNVLYTSQKLQELFSDDHVTPAPHANASGDGDGVPGRCCRLCGGDSNLRYFGDTYMWEGAEERYDQLLFDCFGVKVTPTDCMICEWCVRGLRSTERFRALVHAAFDRPISDLSSSLTTLKSSGVNNDVNLPPAPEKEAQPKKPLDLTKKREVRKKLLTTEAKAKRINIPCEICKQRYPMLVANEGQKPFTCSRCKKNGELRGSVCRKCNIVMPPTMLKDHLDLHAKADLRARNRVIQPKKNLALVNSATRQRTQKFQCSHCPKKYAVARNLALHVRNAHGDSVDNLCSACGRRLVSAEKVAGQVAQQCDDCLLVFKNKKTPVPQSTSRHAKSTTG